MAEIKQIIDSRDHVPEYHGPVFGTTDRRRDRSHAVRSKLGTRTAGPLLSNFFSGPVNAEAGTDATTGGRAMSDVLDEILGGLMRRYKERVPDVQRIIDAMTEEGLISGAEDIENDHIAFRTMGVSQLGLASLEKIFLHCGYEKRDAYTFTEKKLDAFWYSPPDPRHPRIFISELRVGDLSPEARRIIHSYTDTVLSDPVDDLDLDDGRSVDRFLHTPLWPTPTWGDFEFLSRESEYASWVIYNRYYLNHFTISVHQLPDGHNTVEGFNGFLEARGIRLNTAGGKAKVSPDGKLIQSSTVAHPVEAQFSDGIHSIPGSYVEFAERRVLDEYASLPAEQITREHRREGFEAANANSIFESTYTSQMNRNES
jgi:hypothetical protein